MQIFRRKSSSGPPESAAAGSTATARCAELEAFDAAPADDPAPAAGDDRSCQDCVAIGETHWAHLRKCLTCGHIGCCDSSPRRHATGHFHDTGHPVMRSAEPGEVWRWCFVHEVTG
ncbi:UBP-type zinc finger domain-containing protein [Gordonia terrae]|uniref:UBP-type zinc finger domain-containing protein n=1 Tax=Gordonia terrae TaxID=2055 RepID=UPI00200A9B3F|nr:UBP-type zinc finger domain-containing protein [Gordonia terrae]UPW08422.1 UBP-type zinc finger domain-containing protein [Gordonia terrae]